VHFCYFNPNLFKPKAFINYSVWIDFVALDFNMTDLIYQCWLAGGALLMSGVAPESSKE
jgi:hypothetical protein